MRAHLLCLLAVAPLLAGCLASCDPVPPVSARGIGASTPATGGDGGYTATLTVTQEPGGPGLPGAGVVFFWGDETSAQAQDSGRPLVHVGGQAGDASGSVEVGTDVQPPRYTSTLPLRAGSDGVVVAKLPRDRVVGLVAAADGWTEEWIPALATGDAGDLTLHLALYREHLGLDLDGTLTPAGGSVAFVTGDRNAQWYPKDVQVGRSADATAGYLARVVALDGTLNWTNEALGFGDLALAVGPTGDQPSKVQDASTDTALGDRTEQLVLDPSGLAQAKLPAAHHLYTGPATRTGFVAPTGLPYKLHLSLTMDRAQAFRSACGGDLNVSAEAHTAPAGGILLAVGLLGAALAARRRD